MLVKIVTFFLIGMAVLALFGRLRWPGAMRRVGKRRDADALPGKPRKCSCGAYRIGSGPCPCGRD
jgi:hypothetical protein